MKVHIFESDGIKHYEWIFDKHRFIIWFDGDEPGWTFVTDCDNSIMECGELPKDLLEKLK